MNLKEKADILLSRMTKLGSKFERTFKLKVIRQNLLFIVVFCYFAIYLGGFVNTILESNKLPPSTIFSPYKDYQTGTEFIIAVFNFVGGSLGVYLIYKGANSVNRREARLHLVLGMLILIIASIVGVLFLYSKYMI
ncbi:MAG: hypothetical protein ACUVQ8_05480 [Nitrososphaeria archaeon]